MKKSIVVAVLFFLILQKNYGQTIQASIGIGSTTNSMRIYLRPTLTQTPATFSTLQFNVAIPSSVSPVPTLTLVNQAFTGVNWIIDAPYLEDGRWNYNIYTASAGYTLNVSANIEFSAMELAFTGGPSGTFTNTAHITCLPDGGSSSGNAFFFCSGTLSSNGQSLFYARDGNVTFMNGDSYRPGGAQGTFTSFARYNPAITLPVSFGSYEVTCNDKGVLLKWTTAQEQNSDRFEIQRSKNNVDWIVIDNVPAAGISTMQRNYQYLDLNGGLAFYRIRQVDKDGHFVYTAIKRTDCKVSQFDVTLFPVPARDQLTVLLISDLAVKTDLQIIDINGRMVKRIAAQIVKGNNNILLNVNELPAGQYLLASSDPSIIINKKFTVIR